MNRVFIYLCVLMLFALILTTVFISVYNNHTFGIGIMHTPFIKEDNNVASTKKRTAMLRRFSNVSKKLSKQRFIKDIALAEVQRSSKESIAQNSEPHYFLSRPLGRLGNQMFEFAASLGIARKINYTHVVKPEHSLLQYFNITNVYGSNIINLKAITKGQWKNKSWWVSQKYFGYNLTLNGYFHSGEFFLNVSDEVRRTFVIQSHFTDRAKQFLRANIYKTNYTLVGIHVRRGDFLKEVNIKLGRYIVGVDFLAKAKEYFRRKYTDAVFIVISDDMKWCKENIADNNTLLSTFKTPIIDMALMTLCDHMIMSTGTFSWWCAWLCGGTVVYMKDHPRAGGLIEGFHLPSWIGL